MRFPSSASNTLEFILVTQDGGGIRTTRTARRNLLNSVGSWYHAMGTYNKTTGQQRLYVNGELVHTQTHLAGNTIVPLTFYSDMRIGHSRVNVGYFNGAIDDVRLYNLPLSDQEIHGLYNAFTGDLQAPIPSMRERVPLPMIHQATATTVQSMEGLYGQRGRAEVGWVLTVLMIM